MFGIPKAHPQASGDRHSSSPTKAKKTASIKRKLETYATELEASGNHELSQDILSLIKPSTESPPKKRKATDSSEDDEFNEIEKAKTRMRVFLVQPKDCVRSKTPLILNELDSAIKSSVDRMIIPYSLTSDCPPINARGFLFHGPPGTGKTHFAKLFACELNCSFLPLTPSSIGSVYQAASQQNLTAAFEVACENSPCIMFFDEADRFFPKPGMASDSTTEQVYGQFLSEMTKKRPDKTVIVICATNHIENINPAALSRLGSQFEFPLPDNDQRNQMIRQYLGGYPCGFTMSDSELDDFTDKTDGYSGRDIMEFVERVADLHQKKCRSTNQFKPDDKGEVYMACTKYSSCSVAHQTDKPCDCCGSINLSWDQNDTYHVDMKLVKYPPFTFDLIQECFAAENNKRRRLPTMDIDYVDLTEEKKITPERVGECRKNGQNFGLVPLSLLAEWVGYEEILKQNLNALYQKDKGNYLATDDSTESTTSASTGDSDEDD